MTKNLHIVKAQSNCQFNLSIPKIGLNFSNNKVDGSGGSGNGPNNGSKNDAADDNLSVKMQDDDNSSFGSRCINPLKLSAPRLNSYRKSQLQLSAKSSSMEIIEQPTADKQMTSTPSDQAGDPSSSNQAVTS